MDYAIICKGFVTCLRLIRPSLILVITIIPWAVAYRPFMMDDVKHRQKISSLTRYAPSIG